AAQINKFGHRDVNYAESFQEAQRILEEKLREGDLLITLGAGDVWKIGDEFLETTDEHGYTQIRVRRRFHFTQFRTGQKMEIKTTRSSKESSESAPEKGHAVRRKTVQREYRSLP